VNRESRQVTFEAQAHSGEILDLVIFEIDGAAFICTCGRDRIVQIFQHTEESTNLLQSLDEHVAAVNGILFAAKNSRLLTCSADRTVVIRDRYIQEEDERTVTAFVIAKTVTFKSAPVTMSIKADQETLIIACMDRTVMLYDMQAHKASYTFKALDTEKGDPVVLCALAPVHLPNGVAAIAGVASTDKSVRLYQEDGTLLGRDWGHTEGVTDIATVDDNGKPCLVTVAMDGTIFLWSAINDDPTSNLRHENGNTLLDSPLPAEPRTTKPLRRLLSHSDLATFRPANDTTPKAPPLSSPDPTRDPSRAPRLRKSTSRFSLAQAPKLEPLTTATNTSTPVSSSRSSPRHQRSPTSPLSPRASHHRTNTDYHTSRSPRRPSLDMRHRTKSAGNLKSTPTASLTATSRHMAKDKDIQASTQHILRSLRSYRRTLVRSPSSPSLSLDLIREVEKELNLTAKALLEKAMAGSATGRGMEEETLTKLFEELPERIVRVLEDRVARKGSVPEVRRDSEPGQIVGEELDSGTEVEVAEQEEVGRDSG
jgi:hypothetical protein